MLSLCSFAQRQTGGARPSRQSACPCGRTDPLRGAHIPGTMRRVNESEVIGLLLGVVDDPPASRAAADRLESELLVATDLAGVEDFLESLSLYEPAETPGPHLVGYAGLRSAAREALHELDRHDRCPHDIPLTDRP